MMRLFIPLVAGMGVCYLSVEFFATAGSLIIAGLAVSGTAAVMLYRQRGFQYLDRTFGGAVFIFIFLSGIFLFSRSYNKAIAASIGESALIEGIAVESPKEHAKTWSVKLRLENGYHLLAYISKKSTHNPKDINIGDSIRLKIWKAESTHSGYTDGSKDKDDVISSYKRYLFTHRIISTCFAYSWENLGGENRGLPTRLHALQQKMADEYGHAGFGEEEEAVISAMTIGDKTEMSSELKAQYSMAGVSHVLALSGFHLTIICSLLDILLLGRFADRRFRWISKGISVAALWAFAMMAGFQPSLLRSVIMCTMVLLSSMFGMASYQSINSLATAGIGMLVYDPFMLMDIGFQFSFISVLSLCLFSTRMKNMLAGIHNPALKYLAGSACTSCVATVASFPLTAYYFNQLPITGIISNIAVTAIASAVLPVSMIWWGASVWKDFQSIVTAVLDWMAGLMNYITGYMSALDFSTVEWKASLVDVAMAYAVIASVWMTMERPTRKRWYGLAITANLFGLVLIAEALL